MSKKVLGKGLDALIPQTVKDTMTGSKDDQVVKIPVESIAVNRHQPRKRFDQDKIKTLSESIRTDGLL